MNHIDQITDAEIRLNVKRQAKNLINQDETLQAMKDLHATAALLGDTIDPAAIRLMQTAVDSEELIVSAVKSKLALFATIIEENK